MTDEKPAEKPVDLSLDEIKAREQLVADDMAKRAAAPDTKPDAPEPKAERSARFPPSTP